MLVDLVLLGILSGCVVAMFYAFAMHRAEPQCEGCRDAMHGDRLRCLLHGPVGRRRVR
jgi:hypothetical protein